MMLLSALSYNSCTDKDMATSASRDQLFRPMFRNDYNTGKGSTDPYNSVITNLNSAHLYWYTVDDAVGYEIKWALSSYVSGGEQAWIDAENGVNYKQLAGDTVITDPQQFDMIIENLQYQSDYRFAIRALHSYSANSTDWKSDPKNSEWYGYGNSREWAEYFGLQTSARYDVPYVVQTQEIAKDKIVIRINRSIQDYYDKANQTPTDKNADEIENYKDYIETFKEHFNFIDAEKKILKVDYLTFTVSSSTPSATPNTTYEHYDIPESAWVDNVATITVDGLSENSIYNIDVWDKSIPVKVDACYNSLMKRTKGTPGAPILLTHQATPTDTVGEGANMAVYDISKYNSMKLDNIINNYMTDVATAENQVFYLEGGKAYHINGNVSLYKGITIATNPDDLAKGKRAKLYLNGLYKDGGSVRTGNFVLGRQPATGENSTITLDIDSIRLQHLDFDCPLAENYGHQQEGTGSPCGNYLFNMYPNGMGINIADVEMDDCTFQGIVRGFFRIQGSNDFWIRTLKMTNCATYNCGYYDAKGGGYSYFFADHGSKPKSSILSNFEISNCVFYNSPKGNLLTDNNKNNTWDASVKWNINIHHNTLVNFKTPTASAVVNLRYVPGGSTVAIHDNVFIETKDASDVNRVMKSQGCDIRYVQGGDGTGKAYFDIYNNWTTNDEYKPFQSTGFEATKNAPGKFYSDWKDAAATYFPHGKSELPLHVDNLKATDLMASPNPKHFIGSKGSPLDYHTDNGIEGLKYKSTDAVRNSSIYKSGAGSSLLK